MTTSQNLGHDEWQFRLYGSARDFAESLAALHNTTPWPRSKVLDQALNTVATELWDRGFGVAEITSAFNEALADLSRYAARRDVRG